MKRLITKLRAAQASLEAKFLDREECHDNRSEKWQGSEKGEAHQELTDQLREMYDEITSWIDELRK